MTDITDIGRSLANVMTAEERDAELRRLVAEAKQLCQLGELKQVDATRWVADRMPSDRQWAFRAALEMVYNRHSIRHGMFRHIQLPGMDKLPVPKDPWAPDPEKIAAKRADEAKEERMHDPEMSEKLKQAMRALPKGTLAGMTRSDVKRMTDHYFEHGELDSYFEQPEPVEVEAPVQAEPIKAHSDDYYSPTVWRTEKRQHVAQYDQPRKLVTHQPWRPPNRPPRSRINLLWRRITWKLAGA